MLLWALDGPSGEACICTDFTVVYYPKLFSVTDCSGLVFFISLICLNRCTETVLGRCCSSCSYWPWRDPFVKGFSCKYWGTTSLFCAEINSKVHPKLIWSFRSLFSVPALCFHLAELQRGNLLPTWSFSLWLLKPHIGFGILSLPVRTGGMFTTTKSRFSGRFSIYALFSYRLEKMENHKQLNLINHRYVWLYSSSQFSCKDINILMSHCRWFVTQCLLL